MDLVGTAASRASTSAGLLNCPKDSRLWLCSEIRRFSEVAELRKGKSKPVIKGKVLGFYNSCLGWWKACQWFWKKLNTSHKCVVAGREVEPWGPRNHSHCPPSTWALL